MIAASALSFLVLAGAAASQESAECQVAIKLLSARLPELTTTATGYEWRGLPTAFMCDADGTVVSVGLRWTEGRGLLSDARSASAAFGSRLTGDTATAVRDAFDRCVAAASRSISDSIEVTTGRASLTCTITGSSALIVVGKRFNR